jgi:hypothetical protein
MKPVKLLGFIVCMFLTVWQVKAQTDEVAKIRAQMAKIRQTTNWSDPAAAKKANEQISALAKKMIAVSYSDDDQKNGGKTSEDTKKTNELNQELTTQKMDIIGQVMKAVGQGEDANILLADPLQKEIAEEFKEDESPAASNTEFLEKKQVLYIDMSLSTAQLVIDQMTDYKSVRILILTGGKKGAAVNLNDLFARASAYPLEELYVINFHHFVKSIPLSVTKFTRLTTLGLFNNQIGSLPQGLGTLTSLKKLYVDINPIQTLYPAITSMVKLDTLGVAQTKLPEAELAKIGKYLPNCKLLTK